MLLGRRIESCSGELCELSLLRSLVFSERVMCDSCTVYCMMIATVVVMLGELFLWNILEASS